MKLTMKRLIRKYSRSYTIIRNPDGEIIDGRYEEGQDEEFTEKIAMFPIRPEQIQEDENVNYTTEDKKVYQPIDAENVLQQNDLIIGEDHNYEIREVTDFSDFADFKTFVAVKKVVEND